MLFFMSNHNTAYYTKEEIDKTIADVISNGEIDLTIYAKKADVDTALIGKADREHTHDISNIDNLQDILNSKLELKDIQETLDGKANEEHTHAEYIELMITCLGRVANRTCRSLTFHCTQIDILIYCCNADVFETGLGLCKLWIGCTPCTCVPAFVVIFPSGAVCTRTRAILV